MSKEHVVSRRAFLRGAVATAAVPTILAACPRPGRAAANNRLNIGCIGVGSMGGGHHGGLLGHPDVQIVAVCDVDSNNRERARVRTEQRYADDMKSGTYKGCAAYKDFRELLARDDIDAVVIAVPDHWHASLAVAAAQAGKDIYCEKPMALTIREARAMVNAVRRYERVFQTGSQQRSSGEFRKACELVRNGRIGRVVSINVNVGGPSRECFLPEEPIPEGLDWDFWLGPAPYRPFNGRIHPYNWRDFRDYSGGQMTDWGAHHFDIAQWALGMDDSGPVEVHPPDGKEYKLLTYKYANGVTMFHGGGGNGVVFNGTEGKIEVNRGHFKSWPDSIGEEPLGPNDIRLYQSRGHMQDWLDCIKTRRRPICDVEIGCRSVSVCHIGNICYWLNQPLRWDPVKEEFIDNAEANRWLDRPKRAPWHLS